MAYWIKLGLFALIAGSLWLALAACPATTDQKSGTQVEVEVQGQGGPSSSQQAGVLGPAETRSSSTPELAGVAPDIRDYLLAVHRRIANEWETGVLARASATFPPTHPANQRHLVTEIAVALDAAGQPIGMIVSSRSGYSPFDESALGLMKSVRKLPPLPESASEGSATLFWRFHRDERSCSPAHARLAIKPLSPDEAIRRSMARGKLERARQLLRSSGATPEVRKVIAAAGLTPKQPLEVRLLALQLASPEQLDAAIREGQRGGSPWKLLVAALAARKDPRQLIELLERMSSAKAEPARLVDLLEALSSLTPRPSSPIFGKLTARREPAVVIAAANLVDRAALLEPAITLFYDKLEVAGPLAVRQRALGESASAEALIRKALASPAALATLEAMARHKVKAFDAELASLVRSSKSAPNVRSRAIEVLGTRAPLGALYAAARDGDPAVQIAACRVLGRITGNKMAISYRVAELVTRARGAALAEALAALARIAHPTFQGDTLRRAKLLDPKHQPLVAEALGNYGDKAIPVLTKMLEGGSPELQAAAVRGLARIKSEAAKKVLATHSQPATQPAAGVPASPLLLLLQDAVRLSQGEQREQPPQ